MQKSATVRTATKMPAQKAARQPPPKPRAQPRAPLTPDQLAALDVLFAAAKPGFELALGPAGTEINLCARLKRAKRYGYGTPTGVLFLVNRVRFSGRCWPGRSRTAGALRICIRC